MIVEVTIPQIGLPKGSWLEVVRVRNDGSIAGYNYNNENDWTLYYITKGEYVRVKNEKPIYEGELKMNERRAFEVEDIRHRTNYTFVYEPTTKQVDMYNTSLGKGRVLDMSYREDEYGLVPVYPIHNRFSMNPLGCTKADDYFYLLYDRALNPIDDICFLGWVNPDTIEPIEEGKDELDWDNEFYLDQ